MARLGLVSLLLPLIAGVVQAQDTTPPPPRGVLEVRVQSASAERGISGAVVQIEGADISGRGTTDSSGRVVLRGIPPGVYALRVSAIGFNPFIQANVVVSSGKAQTVTVDLWPRPLALADLTAGPAQYFQPRGDATGATRLLGAEETRRSPGAVEDVVRTVALLPGVAVTSAGRNDLVVRGGAPFENLFLVDNIEVPNINHFGSQGSTGGPLSLINTDFIRSVGFSSGGFGVRYGDRTAAVTNITLRDGSTDGLAGEVNLAATGFGVIGEGPLGRNGSFFFGARRSYLDLIFKAAGFSFIPAYWDFQAKGSYRVGDNDKLSFLGIGAINTVTFNNDVAENRFDNSRILSPEQRQYFSGLTWQRALSRGLLTVTIGRTFTRYETSQRDSLDPPQVVFQSFSREGETSLRTDLTLQVNPRLTVTLGNVSKYADDLRYDVTIPGELRRDATGGPRPLDVDTSFTAFRSGTWAQGSWIRKAFTLTLGLRADTYDFLASTFRLSPRAGLSYRWSERTTTTLSTGRYYQAPSFIWLAGDPSNQHTLEPIQATHLVLGVAHLIQPDLRLEVEAYHKRYTDYPARLFRPQAVLSPSGFEDVTNDIPFGLEPLVSGGTGRAYGAELLLQKRLSQTPIYGLLSLSLGRVEFQGLDGVDRPGAFDTRFIGTLLAGYRFNPWWELSGKFRIATGQPTTPFLTTGPLAGTLDFGRYNAGPRLPTFHALDLRLNRRWSFAGWQLLAYVDIQNVYARANVSRLQWNARLQAVEPDESLGILPTIGLNVEF